MMDNAEDYREYCLGLGDVTEKMPFGRFAPRFASILALYTEGHMFTYADVADFSLVTLKAEPSRIDGLYERYSGVQAPLNLSRRYWVGVRVGPGSDVPDSLLRSLLADAYALVRAKYAPRPKKNSRSDKLTD